MSSPMFRLRKKGESLIFQLFKACFPAIQNQGGHKDLDMAVSGNMALQRKGLGENADPSEFWVFSSKFFRQTCHLGDASWRYINQQSFTESEWHLNGGAPTR